MLTYGYGGLCLSPNIGYFLFYSSRISVCMANGNVRHLTWISVVHHMPIEFFYPTSAVKPSAWYVCEKERECTSISNCSLTHALSLSFHLVCSVYVVYCLSKRMVRHVHFCVYLSLIIPMIRRQMGYESGNWPTFHCFSHINGIQMPQATSRCLLYVPPLTVDVLLYW